MNLLRDYGGNFNMKLSDGYTPLMSACEHNNFAYVQFLVQHGADIHAKNSKGQTPIFGAYKSLEIIQMLVKCGADPFVTDNVSEYQHKLQS